MKIHLKYFALLAIIMTSTACSLPFLAGDSADREPTEAITTEMPTPVQPTLAQPTPAEVTGGVDPCLIGVWTMDTYSLNNKFLDLTQSPIMYIVTPSAMTMALSADGKYTINGETIVRADIPNGSNYMQLAATHSGEGRYSADGSSISLSDSTYAVDFGTMIMNIDGETTEGPFSAITLPDNFMSPPAVTAYVCSANQLLVTYDGPLGQLTEEWAR